MILALPPVVVTTPLTSRTHHMTTSCVIYHTASHDDCYCCIMGGNLLTSCGAAERVNLTALSLRVWGAGLQPIPLTLVKG